MSSYYNQSSYYRANPFYKQRYLVDAALKNRRQPESLVELPQGDNHFINSNRKHFVDLLKKSEITQKSVLMHTQQNREKSNIAINKQYPRNLQTKDIEGAVANTLKSNAIKNKEKIRSLQAIEKPKQIYQIPNNNNRQHFNEFIKKYQEQQLKTSKNRRYNQANQSNDIVEKRVSYHFRNKQQKQRGNNKSEQNKNQLQEQRNIGINNNKNDKAKSLQKQSKSVDSKLPFQYQNTNEQPKRLMFNNLQPPITPQLNKFRYQLPSLTPQKHTNQIQNNYNNISLNSHNSQSLSTELPYNKSKQSSTYQIIHSERQKVMRHRKLAPTFLSYGSPVVNTFNMAAKQIINK